MNEPIRTTREKDGALLRVVLDRPKGNVLDSGMVGALRAMCAGHKDEGKLKLLVLEGAGAHFSFGASVEEHLPEKVEGMLTGFHALFRDLEDMGVPTAAVVRGQCLGGGMELALWCGKVFCTPETFFGLPEVKLGVFPPVGAFLLPWRTGGGWATELLLTGESVGGEKATQLGLADVCDADPEAALQKWFDAHLAPKSAVALRHVWRATRRPLARALRQDLPEIERQYLAELMSHRDPTEGIRSFLERRAPSWEDR